VANRFNIGSRYDVSMTDSRLLHSVDRQLQVDVPKEVLTEVARRTSADATRTEIRDALHDHVRKEHEFRGPDGSSAVDMILQSKTDPSDDVDSSP
jgi:hypothetical protein